jgi:NAD-dependent SIR2 family protein deacetylase
MTDTASDRNVFILGAGFSKDAGVPVIHDFLDRSREFFDNPESGLDGEERLKFDAVFKFKREMARAREKFRIDLDNVEELFGLVEMSHRLGSVALETRDATVYLIAKTIQLALRGPSERPQVIVNPLQGYGANPPFQQYFSHKSATGGGTTDIYTHFALLLAGRYDDQAKMKARSNTIITFNYDLVLDDALVRVDAKPDYGLDGAHYEREYQGQTPVAVLKLHGSTNWAICSNCNQVRVLDHKVTAALGVLKSQQCGKCGNAALRILLVPPSWDKSEYSKTMQSVWRKAVDELKRATRICVIGYSMPPSDAFFKFLLSLGLAENDRLYKLSVVDWIPDGAIPTSAAAGEPEPINLRWKRMLEGVFEERRFKFFPEGTAQFLRRNVRTELQRGERISS